MADSTQLLGPYPADCREHEIPFWYDQPYADRIGAVLYKMPVDGIFDIASNVKAENRDKFVGVVKTYIQYCFGEPAWQLEFNADYTRIRKVGTVAGLLSEKEAKRWVREPNWRDAPVEEESPKRKGRK